MTNKLLSGKVALITGAAMGIGRVCASHFAEEGAKLVLVDIDVEQGEVTSQQVRSAGGEAIFVRADVTHAVEVEAAVAKVVEQWGRLDCALNNAGIDGEVGATGDCSEENFDRVVAVNLKGVFSCMKYEIRQMLAQGGGGSIVNVASVAGLAAYPGLPAYVAAKHGVVGISRAAGLEYAKAGIRVNALCPGVIRTRMLADAIAAGLASEEQLIAIVPGGRLGDPKEIAQAAAWMCSDKSSYMVGHAMAVDGGIIAG